jgi:hypothetical protein
VNKTSAKVGISIILAGIGIAALGLMIKISHDSCLEMIKAFERGESGVIPLCQEDSSAPYFLAALPVVIIGIFVLVLAKKDSPILQKIFGEAK